MPSNGVDKPTYAQGGREGEKDWGRRKEGKRDGERGRKKGRQARREEVLLGS